MGFDGAGCYKAKTPKAFGYRGFWCFMVLDEAMYWGD
jgi:hypothetical protein